MVDCLDGVVIISHKKGGDLRLKNTSFISTVSSIEDVATGNPNNPLLTLIKFVFSDNQGNANGQGIESEDFDAVIQSSLNMPIKIGLTEGNVGNHDLSIPIGHITEMETLTEGDISKLVASAVLYKQEFPQEVQFLKDSFNKGEAPGISWELAFKDSVKKDGIEWLKKVITSAATFVKNPAYGSRTALLAIASSAASSSNDEVMERVEEIVNLWRKENPPKANSGGMNVDELEKAQKQLSEATEKIKALETELATKTTDLTAATTKVTDLTTQNAGLTKAATIDARTRKFVEAGFTLETDADKLSKKQELWLTMSDEVFNTYIEDMVSVKAKPASAAAASAGNGLPRLAVAGLEQLNLSDLKIGLKRASMGLGQEEE